ncbi:hypothetical protein [uncultured Aliiroseovarius sp.]|uniref:hypothetical protein n=1 Tax=uncultured Aliiroseovarius sp. TaxID=1658783 RepID=UPI002593BD6E|nr:hypothetical protein [uncultured Aliiroseovarius sp.]
MLRNEARQSHITPGGFEASGFRRGRGLCRPWFGWIEHGQSIIKFIFVVARKPGNTTQPGKHAE